VRNLLGLLTLSAVCIGPLALGGCSATMRSAGSEIPAAGGASAASAGRVLGVAVATVADPLHGLRRTFAPAKPASGRHASWFARGVDAKTARLLYVANWYGSGVEIYSVKAHQHVGHIDTSPYQPNSVHVGDDGNIWVALNTDGADPSIYVYQPGATTPFRTLNGVANIPVSIALAKDGTVYVTDENIGVGELIVFAPNSNTPTTTLNDPNATCCGWVAVDHHGNVFFTYESQSGHSGAIDEFVKGKGKPVSLGITLTTFPGGIEVLKDGSLVVVEQGIPDFSLAARIDTFPKGATQPSSVISGNVNCDNWVGPALDKKEKTVYVGSTLEASPICGVNGAFGAVEEFSYPAGSLLDESSDGLTDQGGWTLLVPALNPPAAGQ
jgi:hypothetical protein